MPSELDADPAERDGVAPVPKTCLRCDWSGATNDLICPDCGAQPLWVASTAPTPGAEEPTRRGAAAASLWAVDAPGGTLGGPPREPTLDPPRPPRPYADDPSGRPRRGVVVIAVVVVSIVLFGSWLRAAQGPAPIGDAAPGEPSASAAAAAAAAAAADAEAAAASEAVAMGFMEAFAAFDAETAMTYVAPDADLSRLIEPQVRPNLRGLTLMLGLLEAHGYEQRAMSCEAVPTSSDIVSCAFDFHAIRSDEIDRGPFSGSTFTFTVQDGAIVRGALHWDIEEFSPQMWEPFAGWVSSTYPEDAAVMYVDERLTNFRLTEESIRLWARRSREYVRVVTAGPAATAERFMGMRNDHDVDEAMSLLAHDGADVLLLHDNRLSPGMPVFRLDRDELALAFEAERLLEVRYRSVACGLDPTETSDDRILCSFEMQNRLRRIAGLPPVETQMRIEVRDGHVTFLSLPWLNAGFPGDVPSEAWRFIDWLQVRHPEVGAPGEDGTLFWTGGQEMNLVLTPRSIQLLERFLDEYEASERSGAEA